MEARWSNEKRKYEIEFTEKELGLLLFALTVAEFEADDKDVAEMRKQLTNLNEVN